ncbi:MAG: methylmalonyl-CoA mutase family protein [Thaumarchaeota archaeon]|nr:methylmalonyl-CoA mutase family protein [Candidatus Geocrenenecus arthurdayi]MCL7389787.1 methylmalonyl-CoA mutase family protein [Candidatus Geocrenenecus arthurdayi]MCL7390994.1 methylmalonyl-CoA mutase family protein [Candidatus Geocrenenecus arthurdayi]MCL7396116.1 methylmalonyl-CoA mutase family protein [Candidatus Geocrenenecus arthurdayi]MCL7401337.1 methylmalonyl-CoA mutase family protein [Candidatus Geocrenenecus arthurdayi]
MRLFDEKALSEIEDRIRRWEKTTLVKSLERFKERMEEFTTLSDIKVKRVYTPTDISNMEYFEKLGLPGEYPFTRGIHATMYRGRLWTMRMFSGYGSPEDTNRRLKYLIAHGETGLSLAFDYPTLVGIDADDPAASGEVGVCGVSVSSLRDMEIIYDGIDMGSVTTNMTINPPAPILLSMYVATAEKQGVTYDKIGGTTQNDPLKEFIAQKSYVFPPEPAVKISMDVIEWSVKNLPLWNPISISGYHIREAGATAVQELAFTLADGIEYVRQLINRGMDIDDFAHRLSFFFDAHINFFEEIAKFRAARRMWAKIMKEWFNAKKERSLWMRFHTQTAGVSLTAQQPFNNIVRTTIEALAAVLGGTQSLHTNALDEPFRVPSEFGAKIALRTQQIIAYETGVADVVDPLAGSYYVEWLTDEIEQQAWRYIDRIEKMGGMLEAVKKGYPQREVTEASYRFQREVEENKRFIVGVNIFIEAEQEEIRNVPLLDINQEEIERKQIERLRKLRSERNNEAVSSALNELRRAAERSENVMPYILEAVKKYATLGEIMNTLKEVYGVWIEPPIY